MTKKIDKPFYKCPRYDRCYTSNCPLDPEYPERYIEPKYREQRCTIGQAIRTQIAAKFPGMLCYEGYTKQEYETRNQWAQSHENQKRQAIGRVVDIKSKLRETASEA